MFKKNWYVLYTSPRFEKRVLERLELNGTESYLPLHRCPRVWSDRVKLVEIPLFNSYIFVHCKPHEVMPLVRINGVVRVVFYDGKPAIIRPFEIEAIKRFLEVAKEKTLCTGDEVEILTGMLRKKSGKIIKIKKKFVMIHIDQLAATVCVNTGNIRPLKKLISQ